MSRKGENIYKRKDGRWEGRYKKGFAKDGRTLYGSCYGKTYREVKAKLEEKKQTLSAYQPESTGFSKKLFGVYCDEWLLVNRNRLKESTAAKYKIMLEAHIKPYFGNCQPERITTEMTANFINWMIAEKELSPKTAKDTAIVFTSILKYISQTNNGIGLVDVFMPRYVAKEIRVLTKEEQNRFVNYLMAETDSYKFGILFALMTGLRIGEICALRMRDISLADRTVTVRQTIQRVKNLDGDGAKTKIIFSEPKSIRSSRIVPLTETAYELCKRQIGRQSSDAFLLTGSEEKYIEPRVLQYHIKKYSRECGLEDVHFHVLRHTFATRCVEVGFEIKTLSEVLGHSTPSITLERYVHSSLEFKRQNMTKLETIGF